YLKLTGRSDEQIDLVERYAKEQMLFRDASTEPEFTDFLELDISTVEPCLAGPKRPQDRVPLRSMKKDFNELLTKPFTERGFQLPEDELGKQVEIQNGDKSKVGHGVVVIAAITSCTNTSDPLVLVAAGLLAKKAVEKGLNVKPYVKTSMAPGSRVVIDYLEKAGLMASLEQLGFHNVGFGCTTCIGNSGPLSEAVVNAIESGNLIASAVLSGNRNFEGRINQLTKANYLASPPLVVAYALAGTTDIDLTTEALGTGSDGQPVYLKDIWPAQSDILEIVAASVSPEMFKKRYSDVFSGNPAWDAIPAKGGDLYPWEESSTYIQNPPFFENMPLESPGAASIKDARVLCMLGDSITTDHISPAGAIMKDSPAGKYLIETGVEFKDFNSYGSRRGNDRVMTRGTFANVRLRNLLAPGTEGGLTIYLPTGVQMTIYEAAMKYKSDGTSLVVLAGKDYGMGSSRDWAAKGTFLLGIKAVIAESFERIHRSNLIGMGVLPLQFMPGESRQSLGLSGHETFAIELPGDLGPKHELTVKAVTSSPPRRKGPKGDAFQSKSESKSKSETLGDWENEGGNVPDNPPKSNKTFNVIARLDTPIEVDYYNNGGILQTVLRGMVK
ncbi:MAG: aconitate hydratase AcnA, partial [candidate division Zixibacteria bacterium]|nr:aconitate hydratase AcnA [candidate division Zixibacteria bacterium]